MSEGLTYRKSQAFTLMEVMLAVAVCAVVLVAINGVFFSALRLRARTSAALDDSASIELALSVMRRDLANAVAPGGVLAGTLQSGVVSGTLSENNGIELYTSTGLTSEADSFGDIQRVTYQLQPPANPTSARGNDLIRGTTRNLLSVSDEEEYRWLLGGIEQLEFAYFDGSTWQPSWDSTLGATNLPSAIRVRIHLASESSASVLARRQPVELVVPLIVQARASSTPTTTGQ